MTAQGKRKRTRILSISDEVALHRLIRAVLCAAQPGHFAVAPIGFKQLARTDEKPDIIIVDLPRPHRKAIASIRRRFPGAEIIALSVDYRESDAIPAIDAGVECLGRPFRESELVWRVHAAELRLLTGRGVPRSSRIGEALYDALEGRVLLDGAAVDLNDAEATVLSQLLRAEGKVVAFAELENGLGRRDDASGRQRVRSVIWLLRRKIGSAAASSPIENEPRIGYRLSRRADNQRRGSN